MKRIEIFAAGHWTDASGRSEEFPPERIAEIAAQDLANAPVPLVAGHPQTDDPALGWLESLRFEAGKLLGDYDPERLAPGIREFLEAPFRPFRKISVRLWHPEHPSNPRPGKWGLAHVGLLGAAPPAIPGLEPAFSGEDSQYLYTFMPLSKSEPTETEPVDSKPESQPASIEAKPESKPVEQPDFSAIQANLQAQIDALKNQNQALSREYAATQAQLNAERIARKFDELATTRPGLVCHRNEQIEFLSGLSNLQPADFAVAGKSLVDFHLDFLATAYPIANLTDPVVPTEDPKPVIDFSAPPGAAVDSASLALHQKASAYASEHGVDYLTALQAVS